jgi:hypothetical protein
MWQRPNCLFPPSVVRTAIACQIRLAHHVDIGVAHWRPSADLDWLDWLVGRLGGAALPRMMHAEAIVWAALAMRVDGTISIPLTGNAGADRLPGARPDETRLERFTHFAIGAMVQPEMLSCRRRG